MSESERFFFTILKGKTRDIGIPIYFVFYASSAVLQPADCLLLYFLGQDAFKFKGFTSLQFCGKSELSIIFIFERDKETWVFRVHKFRRSFHFVLGTDQE
jgi:hypothetical protein